MSQQYSHNVENSEFPQTLFLLVVWPLVMIVLMDLLIVHKINERDLKWEDDQEEKRRKEEKQLAEKNQPKPITSKLV